MKTNVKIFLTVFATVSLVITPALAGKLIIGSKLEPSSIDPHYHNLGPNNAIARHFFDQPGRYQ